MLFTHRRFSHLFPGNMHLARASDGQPYAAANSSQKCRTKHRGDLFCKSSSSLLCCQIVASTQTGLAWILSKQNEFLVRKYQFHFADVVPRGRACLKCAAMCHFCPYLCTLSVKGWFNFLPICVIACVFIGLTFELNFEMILMSLINSYFYTNNDN